MATKRLTREEIVREIAGAYTLKNRAYSDKWMSCCYTDKNGNHCAVGRCMLAKKRPGINTDLNTDSIDKIIGENGDLDHLLKEKYRGHGYQFWSDLQRLHDHASHWTETGISDKGKKFVLDTFGVKI
jgi:hypothetical protein